MGAGFVVGCGGALISGSFEVLIGEQPQKSRVNKQFRALDPVRDESLMRSTQICCHIISPFYHFPVSTGLTEKQA